MAPNWRIVAAIALIGWACGATIHAYQEKRAHQRSYRARAELHDYCETFRGEAEKERDALALENAGLRGQIEELRNAPPTPVIGATCTLHRGAGRWSHWNCVAGGTDDG